MADSNSSVLHGGGIREDRSSASEWTVTGHRRVRICTVAHNRLYRSGCSSRWLLHLFGCFWAVPASMKDRFHIRELNRGSHGAQIWLR